MAAKILSKRIDIVAYSGYKANERPLYFVLGEKRVGVKAIMKRWIDEDHDYFQVLAEDGKTYVIKRDRDRDLWFLERIFPVRHSVA